MTILGTSGADRIVGTPGRDVISTLGGDDRVTGLGDRDRVCAGGGDDHVRSAPRASGPRVDLGAGHDVFRGNSQRLLGGPGADRLRVGEYSEIDPGPGGDLVVAARVREGASPPCLAYDDLDHGIDADLARGWVRAQGPDRVRGMRCLYATSWDDRVTGSDRADRLFLCGWRDGAITDSGSDVVHAGGGDDEVNGCDGGDTAHLGDGDDVYLGGEGDDRAYGDNGNDWLAGIGGSDHLEGGDGNDRVNATFYCDLGSSAGDGMGDTSPNQIYGGNGNDEVTGDLGIDLLDGGPGSDIGYGGRPGRERGDVFISVEQHTSCP